MDPLPTYVGVYQSISPSSTSRLLTHLLLSYLTGDQTNQTKSECIEKSKEDQV